jgi:hypothetical protein
MKSADLSRLSVESLVRLYEKLALDQHEALLKGEQRELNALVRSHFAIEAELKSRPGDRRDALFALYSHPSPQVRVRAATATLALAPLEARAALQLIIDRREFPQAGDAGMTLSMLDEGLGEPGSADARRR